MDWDLVDAQQPLSIFTFFVTSPRFMVVLQKSPLSLDFISEPFIGINYDGDFILCTTPESNECGRDTTIAFLNKWKGFFYDLEHSHLLNPLLNWHIWLLHFLFLGKIDGDYQKWANHWNNHKLSLHGCSTSLLQIWMESQLLHGAHSLEHLTPDDPCIAAPLAAVPNMDLNDEMLSQLHARQRIHIHTSESGTLSDTVFEP
ncbi:hypothetical protein IW261DRAFT_1566083 [Armillaria novae-zelandiae]|uniref:Integrase core domain-containing protein n=1 Tax=Armillaria novae-zelandiae TaxID=153914 RepID=A0AA39U948_9AGAR|nr:hypothetical protein IW261DRAFT_1566083 [Armillaria novae-zelandiae]